MLDPCAIMAERAEDPTVTEADQAFSDAVIALRDAVPAELRGQVLDVESLASAWGVALQDAAFFAGLELGLRGEKGVSPLGDL
jgi:hypothetical protein